MLQISRLDRPFHLYFLPVTFLLFRKIKYPKVNSLAHILSLQQTKHEDNICGTRLVELEVLRNDLKSCSSCKEGKCLLWSSEVSCSNSGQTKAK